MVEKKVGLECRWKVKHCSIAKDTTRKARATCCAGVKNDCFVTDTVNPDSMTQVLSHARKNHVCGCATYAWVEGSVYTLRRLQRNRH